MLERQPPKAVSSLRLTQERAREIMRQAQARTRVGPWVDQIQYVITPEEDAEVKRHWSALPSSATWMDAFYNILQNTARELG